MNNYGFAPQGVLMGEPPAPKKSILDSVLERLYPSGAFGDLLPPEMLHDERMMALRRSGLSLMASAGPRSGYDEPRSFGADLANALNPDQWQQQIGQTAQTALAIHGTQRKLREEQDTDAILAQYPVKPGASPQEKKQRLQSLAEAFQQRGLWEPAQIALKMSNEIGPEPVQGHAPGTIITDTQGNPIRTLPKGQPEIPASQVLSTVQGEVNGWEQVGKDARNFRQISTLAMQQPSEALPPQTAAALLSASQKLTGAHGGMPGEEGGVISAVGKAIPELGHLAHAIQQLGAAPSITKTQARELVALTEKVIERLNGEAQRSRTDGERRLQDAAELTPIQIRALLPTQDFTWGAPNVNSMRKDLQK